MIRVLVALCFIVPIFTATGQMGEVVTGRISRRSVKKIKHWMAIPCNLKGMMEIEKDVVVDNYRLRLFYRKESDFNKQFEGIEIERVNGFGERRLYDIFKKWTRATYNKEGAPTLTKRSRSYYVMLCFPQEGDPILVRDILKTISQDE